MVYIPGFSEIYDILNTFFNFITSIFIDLGGVIDFFVNVVLAIKDFIIALFAVAGTLLTILYYLFQILEFFVSIVLNPYLLGLLILGSGFWYASFTAETKKDLIIKTGIYYKWIFETIPKVVSYILKIVMDIITRILDMI